MWKWFALWILFLTGVMLFIIKKGVNPKPISKIKISAFERAPQAATAIAKRLFLEIRDSRTVVLTTFHETPWMKDFVTRLAVESNKHRPFSQFYAPISIPGFQDLPQSYPQEFFYKGGRKFVFDPNPQFWMNPKVDALKMFFLDLRELELAKDVTCKDLNPPELYECLAKDFFWRIEKKPHQAPAEKYILQVEQVGLRDFLIFIRSPQKKAAH